MSESNGTLPLLLKKLYSLIEVEYKMSAIAAGQKTWSSLLEILALQNHRITESNALFCLFFDQKFTAGLKINFGSTGAAEPHQTSTPAAAVLRAAQSKTTFAGESLL